MGLQIPTLETERLLLKILKTIYTRSNSDKGQIRIYLGSLQSIEQTSFLGKVLGHLQATYGYNYAFV